MALLRALTRDSPFTLNLTLSSIFRGSKAQEIFPEPTAHGLQASVDIDDGNGNSNASDGSSILC